MLCSLLTTYVGISIIGVKADTKYIEYFSQLLLLLIWISPVEVAIANVLFKMRANNIGQSEALTGDVFFRLIAAGGGGGAVFYILSNFDDLIIAIGVGVLIGLRILEYIMKINLIFIGYGQFGQIIVNISTSLKWIIATAFIIGNQARFEYLLFANIAVSAYILYRLFLKWNTADKDIKRNDNNPNENHSVGYGFKDDLIGAMGIALALLAYQIDKYSMRYHSSPEEFGQYMILCSQIFIGAQAISPIFTIYQQLLFKGNERVEVVNCISLIKVMSFIVALTVPLVVYLSNVFLNKKMDFIDDQIGIIAMALYLNCMSHINYFNNQSKGQLINICKANARSAGFAVAAVLILFLFNIYIFSFVLVAAGVGQYYFKSSLKNESIYIELVLLMGMTLFYYQNFFSVKENIGMLIFLYIIFAHLAVWLEVKKFGGWDVWIRQITPMFKNRL